MGRRKQQPVLCGSKSSRKRPAGSSGPAQGSKSQKSLESDVSTNQPSDAEQELSRSGKPIGWKVLPREAPQQPSVHLEVLHSKAGHNLTAHLRMYAYRAQPRLRTLLAC